MKTTMTRRTPAKTRIRNFFGHRSILRASSSHNPAEYKQVATQPLHTMHSTPRCGDNVIADLNTSGEVVRSYVTPGLDSNVSMTVHDATTSTYYYNADERQSVMNLTDDTGIVVNDYAYSAYGDKVDALTGGSVEQRYTYTGRELSDTTGDFYFRYRTYSAGTGSFLERDPLGYVDGSSVYAGWFAGKLSKDPKGLEEGGSEKKPCKCVVKSGPTYAPQPPKVETRIFKKIPGWVRIAKWAKFTMNVEFEHDPENGIDAACCRIRQLFKWEKGPSSVFLQGDTQFGTDTWYVDRPLPFPGVPTPPRYGEDGDKGYYDYGYRMKDRPNVVGNFNTKWEFMTVVLDICTQAGNDIYLAPIVAKSDIYTINWPKVDLKPGQRDVDDPKNSEDYEAALDDLFGPRRDTE